MDRIDIPYVKLVQPIGEFYIGVVEARDLASISFSDIRRPEGRDIERYIGTQRDLSEGRVAEIKKYVTTVDACFPTSIILAISPNDVIVDEEQRMLRVRKDAQVAKIIDGQHRIAGLENYAGELFQINVTIFIDMDLEDQAMVFATINLKQTKVTKSLAYDLIEYAESRSPQKTCHNIAKLLNFRESSPLFHCLKILGKSSNHPLESITQSTFVDRVMKLVSKDPMQDKDLIKRGKKLQRAEDSEQKKLLFRNIFIDGDDARIALILWEYFSAVENRWPRAWKSRDAGDILGRSTGFAALVRLLPELVVRITKSPLDRDTSVIHRDEFKKLLDLIPLDDDQFRSDRFLPGSTGEASLFREFTNAVSANKQYWGTRWSLQSEFPYDVNEP